jgi:hypothetical protein
MLFETVRMKGHKNMNNKVIRRVEMLERVDHYGTASGLTFNPRATALFAQVHSITTDIREHGVDQVFGRGGFRAGTDDRQHVAKELRGRLSEMAQIGRSLPRAQYPTSAEQFRMPRTRSYQALRATALAFAEAATPIKQAFLDREFPADFLEQLAAVVETLDEAHRRKSGGLAGQVGGTEGMRVTSREAMDLVRELDAILTKKLRKSNPSQFAAWQSASRVERDPQREPVEGPRAKVEGSKTEPAMAPA